MLIRNTDWARALLADMAAYGRYPTDWGREAAMRAALPSYDTGMYEQNMLVYTIMRDPAMMDKVCRRPGCCGAACPAKTLAETTASVAPPCKLPGSGKRAAAFSCDSSCVPEGFLNPGKHARRQSSRPVPVQLSPCTHVFLMGS